ncbi:MAG: tannase/feruloyl esterase family alpha/beta hydrolase [Acidobacteriota bacterium]|jgi:feruloyl esterase|nr:tannase/feruloyl esterase family alpha/beta hydrolase [Acidobacteriota bacterium]
MKINTITIGRAFAAALILFLSKPALGGEANAREKCASLSTLSTPTFRVDTAEWVAAGRLPAGPFGETAEAPSHCLFRVVLDPRESGMEEMSYGTGIELRMPLDWNGRMLFQGGGGLDGVLIPAFGSVSGFPSALARGFAVVSTDGGHRGRNNVDARFAVDQQAKLDFAYQAVARTTREAKALIGRYYGRKPEYSYFMGCSTGGREAMMAAQRLPLEFDGVVAGNPSFNLTQVAVNQIWSLQAVARIAPRDETGKPLLFEAFTDAQLQAVAAGVLGQCDALDGLADGIIHDYQACRFDPASLRCGTAPCLSTPQIEALKDIHGGTRNSRGESLYGSTPYDTGIGLPAWRAMHLGTRDNPPANASLGRDTLRLFSMTPADPELDPLRFDFDRDIAATAETAAINDAVATLHTSFAGHGGKMIVYHGLSDQAMWAGALTRWYERLTPRDGQGPQSWARLFLVPGMTHCGGGQSTDRFDMLSAIQEWVEQGRAPDRVVASGKAFPGVTRPLCPYPKVARFDGGDEDDEKSFSCR